MPHEYATAHHHTAYASHHSDANEVPSHRHHKKHKLTPEEKEAKELVKRQREEARKQEEERVKQEEERQHR